ncbi:MAG: hypothetical protein KatS3mg105_1958 [Gemmatales bacterium]|nr:MAG: hypothetical protein KatS3mg105_1958 [Gemmatales bacterium]
MNFFKLDGSNEATTVPLWSAKAKVNCPRWLDIQVAISPDGRYAYLSNVAGVAYDGKKPEDIDPNWPQGRIYRKDLKQPDRDPEPFYDLPLPDFSKTPYWMPSAWDKKTAAAGIDVDADGHVFVGDLVNHEVVEISPEGKRVSAVKVPWPDKVMVSRRTGTLYVISRKVSRGQLPPAKLSKITGRGKDAKIVAELQLEGTIGGAYTLDESGKAPVLWLAGSVDGTDRLVRVEDRGNNFVITGDRFLNADANAIAFVGYLDVDAEAELVYVTRSGDKIWRFDGRTGQGGLIPIKAVDLAIGRNGMIYTWGTGGYQGPIARYSRDLKPAPLASGEHTYGYLYGRAGRGASVCGIDVDLLGRVFATWGTNRCFVLAYDAEGKPVPFKRKAIMQTRKGPEEVPVAISGVAGYGGSLRVDYQGNLYLLQKKLPKDFHPPKEWAKDEAYRHAVGTIYKFPPEGGEVHADNSYRVKEVVGAVRAYPDCGPISQWRCAGSCACTKPRFDVDGYGRLYIPNGITFRVSVRDNNNNEIVGFGGYGNLDCQGPKSNEPSPSIPLGWPVAVGASDDFIYVGDCLNHRVVRVDKKFAAVRSVPIK